MTAEFNKNSINIPQITCRQLHVTCRRHARDSLLTFAFNVSSRCTEKTV